MILVQAILIILAEWHTPVSAIETLHDNNLSHHFNDSTCGCINNDVYNDAMLRSFDLEPRRVESIDLL